MGPGMALVLAVYALAIAAALCGGVLVRRLSGGYAGRLDVLKSALSWFRLFANPKFLAVLALSLAGLWLIASSHRVEAYPVEGVYYRYGLGEQQIWSEGKLDYIKYTLYEYPVKTVTYVYNAYFQPAGFLIGLALIIAALALTGYWLAKANNELYQAKKFQWEV